MIAMRSKTRTASRATWGRRQAPRGKLRRHLGDPYATPRRQNVVTPWSKKHPDGGSATTQRTDSMTCNATPSAQVVHSTPTNPYTTPRRQNVVTPWSHSVPRDADRRIIRGAHLHHGRASERSGQAGHFIFFRPSSSRNQSQLYFFGSSFERSLSRAQAPRGKLRRQYLHGGGTHTPRRSARTS
jgi:hypothetical protein